jgi:hypothetical protein
VLLQSIAWYPVVSLISSVNFVRDADDANGLMFAMTNNSP